jgi:hypothetical protein
LLQSLPPAYPFILSLKGPYKDKVLINLKWDVKHQETAVRLPYFVY